MNWIVINRSNSHLTFEFGSIVTLVKEGFDEKNYAYFHLEGETKNSISLCEKYKDVYPCSEMYDFEKLNNVMAKVNL